MSQRLSVDEFANMVQSYLKAGNPVTDGYVQKVSELIPEGYAFSAATVFEGAFNWIILTDGTRVTPNHPYFAEDGNWLSARNAILTGRRVVTADGALAVLQGELLRAGDVRLDAGWVVHVPYMQGNVVIQPNSVWGWNAYNLTVERYHSYISSGMRVHNSCLLNGETVTNVTFNTDGAIVREIENEFGSKIVISDYRNPITGDASS